MTQHERILELCRDGRWACQGDFWRISKSPHKRRDDIARGNYRGGRPGQYRWEERRCEHGIANSKDFRLASATISPWQQFEGSASSGGSSRTASLSSAPESGRSFTGGTSPTSRERESESDASARSTQSGPGTLIQARLFPISGTTLTNPRDAQG